MALSVFKLLPIPHPEIHLHYHFDSIPTIVHPHALQCGPCRAFTPQLVKTYETIRDAGKSFQIIFVSSDRDDESMKEYLSEMPWLAIPHGDSRKKALSRLYNVSGMYNVEGAAHVTCDGHVMSMWRKDHITFMNHSRGIMHQM